MIILNKIPYQANGCILMTENESIQSRIAQLHYEYYSDQADLKEKINSKMDQIQCIISGTDLPDFKSFPFGKAQSPGLADYADGVDVMDFLLKLPDTGRLIPTTENTV